MHFFCRQTPARSLKCVTCTTISPFRCRTANFTHTRYMYVYVVLNYSVIVIYTCSVFRYDIHTLTFSLQCSTCTLYLYLYCRQTTALGIRCVYSVTCTTISPFR